LTSAAWETTIESSSNASVLSHCPPFLPVADKRVHLSFQVSAVARAAGLLLLGLVLGVAATLVYQFSFNASTVSPHDVLKPELTANAKRSVFALGTLEPRHGPVMVGTPLAGAQIKDVLVKEGEEVAEGKALVELDPAVAVEEMRMAEAQKKEAEQRQESEIELAQQRLDAADLAVRQAADARELELETQQKRIAAAELKVKQAQNDLDRLESLRRGSDPIVSAQQVEHQKVMLELAVAERDAAKVALKRLEQSLDFESQKGAAEQKAATSALNIAQRGASIELLERRIALAKLKVDQTQVTAPAAGTIIQVGVHPGEVVATQPLLQMADLTDMICIAEVDVADVPLLHEQSEAKVSSRAFRGKTLKATVERIGNLAGSARLRPIDPRQSVDRSVTKVVLQIDASEALQLLGGDQQNVGAAMVGLQVEVEFPVAK